MGPPSQMPSVFVGRDAEIAVLEELVSHPPSIVAVEGETGVGKTRLLREALAAPQTAGCVALIGQCNPMRDPFPLGPVLEALRDVGPEIAGRELDPVAGAMRPLLPEIAEHLPLEPDPVPDYRARRHLLFRGVREVLAALHGAVLVLEDLHWADDETAELVSFLAARPVDRMALVLTYRREAMPAGSEILRAVARPAGHARGARIELHPLSPADVGEMVGGLLGGGVAARLRDWVHERSSGIPFAIEEVVELVRERGCLVREGGEWTLGSAARPEDVPPAVRDATQAQVADLSADAAALLRAASIFGSTFDEDLVLKVAGLPTARGRRALTSVLSTRLLEPARRGGGTFRFRHALSRDAIAEGVLEPDRRQLHRRAAKALSRRGGPLVHVAYHLKHAGQLRQWVRTAERGADLAISEGDDAVAARVLQDLLEERGLPRTSRVRVAGKLGRAALHGLAHREAMTVLRRILEEEDLAEGVRGELRLWVARLLGQAGDASALHEEAHRAVHELRRRPDLAAQAMGILAAPLVDGTSWEWHRRWLDRLEALRPRIRDERTRIRIATDRETALLAVGAEGALEALSALAGNERTIEGRREYVRRQTNRGRAALMVGRYELAERLLKDARRVADAPSFARVVQYVEINQLLLDYFVGRWAGLADRIRVMLEESADVALVEIEAELILALLRLSEGAVAEAEERLERVGDRLRRAGSLDLYYLALASCGQIALHRSDVAGAVTFAERTMVSLRAKGVWAWAAEGLGGAVNVLLQADRRSDATALLAEAKEGLRGFSSPVAEAALLSSRALIALHGGECAAALRLFRRGERAWRALPRPLVAAMCVEFQGDSASRDDERRGVPRWRDALAAYEALGAAWDADRARRKLRDAGCEAPRPWRGGRRGYGDQLSPREWEVAGLVAEGLTNREIAERLYLSPRTVGHHVSRAMRKVGVVSRAALAVAALEERRGGEE